MAADSEASTLRPTGIFYWRGWLGIALLVPLGAAAVVSGRHWPEGSLADVGLDFAGYLLLLAALSLRTWATLYIGGRKSGHLVTGGPYSLSRNPLYLGSLLIGLAIACLLQSLSFGLGVLLLSPLFYLPVIREEERILAANHGEEFTAYRAQVPRLLPRKLRPARTERELVVSMRAMRLNGIRVLGASLIFPLTELIAVLQTRGIVPSWLSLP